MIEAARATTVRRVCIVGCIVLCVFGIGLACERRHAASVPPPVPFLTLFGEARQVALQPGENSRQPAATSELIVDALQIGERILLLDQERAELKVFSWSRGTLLGILGTPGDEPGQLRRPMALAALDSGRFVVYDLSRQILSFRDSLGGVLAEVAVAPGIYGGVVALPDERRLILAGQVIRAQGEARNNDLHEFDYSGRLLTSYARSPRTGSAWEARFATPFPVRMGQTIVTGSFGSRRLRIYDRATRQTRWVDYQTDWLPPLVWPSDESSGGTRQPSVADRANAWARQERLISALFALEGGRLLVRVGTFDPAGERLYDYALVDTVGHVLGVTERTRARIIHSSGDTVYWLHHRSDSGVFLGRGVMRLQPTSRSSSARVGYLESGANDS